MLFKRMDYCEINRQREPAQVFNNYCESGPARGHCSCVASVGPVEYLDPSLPPLSSSPLLQSVHYQCLLPRVRAAAGRRGGRATGGRPRPAPPRPAQKTACSLGAKISWCRSPGPGLGLETAVTVRAPGVGGEGEIQTLRIYLDVLYHGNLTKCRNYIHSSSSFGAVLLFYYCHNVKKIFLYSMMFSLWVD